MTPAQARLLLLVGFALLVLFGSETGAQPASVFEQVRCQRALSGLVDSSKMSEVTARREARKVCDNLARNHRYFYRSLK